MVKILSGISIRLRKIYLWIVVEGNKKNSSRIALANTDSEIVMFFISWLVKYYSVPKHVIKVQLHLYEDMNLEKEHIFWENVLDLSKEQFYKSSVRKLKKGSFTYRESFRHTTCSIYVLGVQNKIRLMLSIKAFLSRATILIDH